MKNFVRIMLLPIVLCCWSCGSGGEDVPTPTPTPKPEEKPKIEVTTTAPVLEQAGGTASVTFTSTADWTIDVTEGRAVSWCNVSPTSGSKGTNTLTITTTGNDTYDERNAKITIKAGATNQTFTITQKQKDGLTVTSNKVEVKAEGGDIAIEVKANVSVTYEIEESAKDWISANESRGLTTKTLNFTAKANEKEERRQGNIVLKGGDGLTETVTVYQEGEKPTLVITSDDIIVGSDGETIKIELKSNVDYTMTMPEVDWISQDDSRAISAYTHYLTVASNEFYDQRSAKIFFQNEAEGLKDSISITQLQKDAIIVAKNEYTVAAEGGNLDFSVNTNVDFEVSVSVDWIKQNTGSRGLVEKPLNFTIEENEAKESRSGVIIITYGDLKQKIKVNQQGIPDYEAIERAALIDLYNAAGGDNWIYNANWCSDRPLNEWDGVHIDNNRVISLSLSDIGLRGYIPESIGNLNKLETLEMGGNQLSGSIPESIGNLSKLKDLTLTSNQLSGSIPESIGNLSNLAHLALGWNHLSGSIPESIGNLSKLTFLALCKNQLVGSIPESIGNLSNLGALYLDHNQLSGNIPSSIGNLTALEWLYLNDNQFSGNIPSSIGNSAKLIRLMLANNQLTGSIPESLGNLINLQSMNFQYNFLSGKIPESFTKLDVWKDCWQAIIIGNPELDLEDVYLPAPEFSVIDINGNQIISENEYNKNKLTILYDWGTWCPYSNAFNSTMLQLYNTYHRYGMEIIGSCVLLDSPMAVEETMSYLEKNSIPWKNIIVSSDNQIDVFHVVSYIPAVIVVDDKKEIIFQSLTEDYNDLAAVVHKYFESVTD